MAEHVARRRRRGEGRRIRLDVRVDEAEHRGLVERAGARGVSIARLMIDAALESAQWEWPDTASEGVEGGGQVARRRPRSEARPIRLEVRLNAAEHRDLVERARERGVSVARLMVDAARGVPPLPAARHVVSAEVQEQFAQLDATWHRLDATWKDLNSRVGNNLNQLAHIANETRDMPALERLSVALEGMEELRRAMILAVSELHDAAVRIGRSGRR